MSIKHLRVQAGGNPARGPHPDMANPTPSTDGGNDFPDQPRAADDTERPQDQPDLDAFAARLGTDTLADRNEGLPESAPSPASSKNESSGSERSAKWRAGAASALGGLANGAKGLAGGLGNLAEKVTPSSDGDPLDLAALRDRVSGIRTVMVTTGDDVGTLSSRPLTVQQISDDGDVMFVVDRGADWVTRGMQAANVALVDTDSTWVSVSGRAALVDDADRLEEFWNPLLDSYFPDGRSSAVLLEVQADRWEYWTAPNKLTQLVEIVSAKINDEQPALGDSGVVET